MSTMDSQLLTLTSMITGDFMKIKRNEVLKEKAAILLLGALGFLFAIVGRSAMAGIGLGIGVYIVESLITTFMVLAGGWVARVPDYLLANNVNAITALAQLPEDFQMGSGFGDTIFQTPGVTHAFITLSIYSLAFIILAFYLFRRRDVTG